MMVTPIFLTVEIILITLIIAVAGYGIFTAICDLVGLIFDLVKKNEE